MIADITQSLRAGIQSAIADTWRQEFPKYEQQQKLFFYDLPHTTIRKAEYGFKERVPMPKPWPYGKGRTVQSFQDRKIEIGIYPFDLTLEWSGWDASDDQLDGPGGIKNQASMATERFLQLPDLLFTEYLTGTAVYNFWGLSTCYDGANMYATTAGGAARFGVTGGNIVTGSGVSTLAKIKDDIVTCKRRFLEFQEPNTGQPLLSPEKVDYNNMEFVIPTELESLFNAISEQELAYTDPGINTAQKNFLVGKIKYHVNQRLTDANDWFVVLKHDYWKPMVKRAPTDVEQFFAEMSNSDYARETKNEKQYNHLRIGLGPWAPFTTIKVSN